MSVRQEEVVTIIALITMYNLLYYIVFEGQYSEYRLLVSLVVDCWHRVREVPGSIPSQGPRHTKDVLKNGTISSLV